MFKLTNIKNLLKFIFPITVLFGIILIALLGFYLNQRNKQKELFEKTKIVSLSEEEKLNQPEISTNITLNAEITPLPEEFGYYAIDNQISSYSLTELIIDKYSLNQVSLNIWQDTTTKIIMYWTSDNSYLSFSNSIQTANQNSIVNLNDSLNVANLFLKDLKIEKFVSVEDENLEFFTEDEGSHFEEALEDQANIVKFELKNIFNNSYIYSNFKHAPTGEIWVKNNNQIVKFSIGDLITSGEKIKSVSGFENQLNFKDYLDKNRHKIIVVNALAEEVVPIKNEVSNININQILYEYRFFDENTTISPFMRLKGSAIINNTYQSQVDLIIQLIE